MEDPVKTDQIFEDPEVLVSQILQKVFLMGFLIGKQQLQDDAATASTPMGQALDQVMQQFEQLAPGTKDAASFNGFVKNLEKYKNLENFAKKEKEKVRIDNQNLTLNDKRLNDQHDVIVKQLLNSLEEEMKSAAVNIIQDTKILKK
jgi:hypothetical protein